MRQSILTSMVRIVLSLLVVLVGATAQLASHAAAASSPKPAACIGDCWRPRVGATFLWQLSGVVRAGKRAAIYDVDAVDTPTSTVTALRKLDRRVICYVSAGSWEEWRADADAFPAAVLGEPLDGWPGERWLDVRAIDSLAPVLRARIEACAAKGFDGIEFDNVDGYANDSGFPIKAADQLRFNRWLANESHKVGLAVGLKNDPDQVAALVRWFDFAVVEQCFKYDECERYAPFIRAGKPVFVAEYGTALSKFCARAKTLRFTAARYPLLLDGRRWACPWPK